jgi:CubicO group peptidase (beta-lactamase class C family)
MTTAALQQAVQDLIDARVAAGAEVGVQVAVIAGGRVVVDAASGLADPGQGTPVAPGTLFFAASAAKGVASAVAHVLAERGLLSYDSPACDVWPQLAAHGKEGITLRHVLLHSAGIPAPPYGATVDQLCDADHMGDAIAAMPPWWPPGSRFGYHALTFGFLLGGIVQRTTGRPLRAWLREAVTGPAGVVDDVHFGVPEALLGRVARQVPADRPPPAPPPGSPADRALPPAVRPDAGYANRRDVLTADIPSQGTMSALGAARLYAALLGHGAGARLVGADRLATMATVMFRGHDEVMDVPTAWAFGFSPHRPGGAASRPGSTFGMMGMNGSAAYADIDSGVAVAVMRNRFDPLDMATVAEADRLVAAAFPPRDRTGP